jgi:hypothetical protein
MDVIFGPARGLSEAPIARAITHSNCRDLHSSFIYIGHRTYNFRNEDNAIAYGNESTGYYL